MREAKQRLSRGSSSLRPERVSASYNASKRNRNRDTNEYRASALTIRFLSSLLCESGERVSRFRVALSALLAENRINRFAFAGPPTAGNEHPVPHWEWAFSGVAPTPRDATMAAPRRPFALRNFAI